MNVLGRSWLVVIAVAAVCVQLWAAAGPVRSFAKIGRRHFQTPTPLVRDTDLDPLARYLSTSALVLARRTIPPGASYAVVVGTDPPVDDPGVVRDIFRFWLYPRTYVRHASAAQWVIAYHQSSEGLGIDYTKEIGLGPDANAVEAKR